MEQLRELWTSVQNVWLKLYGSSFPIVAAINGHCIAGGCFLALSCEYRVMIAKHKIGLNEIQVGVSVPEIIGLLVKTLVSDRQAELLLMTGKIYSTENAKIIGIVDEITDNKDETFAASINFLNRYKNIPFEARKITKNMLRKNELDFMRNHREKDLNNFVKSVINPETQSAIKFYLESLKKRNK
jgi:3,2-trans-enoyl-CoA isomerase